MLEVLRTTRSAAIVLVWLTLTGGAVAQGAFADSTEVIEHGAALVAAIQGALEGDDPVDGAADLVAGITNALYAQVTQDESGEIPDEFPICTYLVGTAGTVPRLDGGGEALAAFSSEFSAIDRIERSAYPLASFEDGAQLVIVDHFVLDVLANSLETWGPLVVDASPPNDDLWSALVGFLLGSEDPSQAFVPHGHVVAFHALSLLPPGAVISATRWESEYHYILDVERERGDGSVERLTVHLIDINFYSIETIKRAMGVVSLLGPPAAVVMSWGLVDCFVRDAYLGTTAPATLAEYVSESLSGREDVEELVLGLCSAVEAVRTELDIDDCEAENFERIAVLGPLAYFADLNKRSNEAVEGVPGGHSYFAAAGNQGLSFSMPPAAWAGIHAVEACVLSDGGSAGLPWFSNRGTTAEGDDAEPVSSLGAWFETVETREGEQGGEPEVLGYWGTSFAAPAAAVNFLSVGFQSAYPPCE